MTKKNTTKLTPRKREPRGDYDVGYARPPVETQFQKGESGNPQGRPRRSLNKLTVMKQSMKRTLEQVVQVRIGDKLRSMPMAEALGVSLVTRAASSSKEFLLFMRVYEKFGLEREDRQEEEATSLEGLDRLLLKTARRMVGSGQIVADPATGAPRFASPEQSLAGKAREGHRKAAEFRKQRGED